MLMVRQGHVAVTGSLVGNMVQCRTCQMSYMCSGTSNSQGQEDVSFAIFWLFTACIEFLLKNIYLLESITILGPGGGNTSSAQTTRGRYETSAYYGASSSTPDLSH